MESRRRFKEKNELFFSTIFMAKIPEKAYSKHIWEFVMKEGGLNGKSIRDIILPKKRDINNNIFSFFKIKG